MNHSEMLNYLLHKFNVIKGKKQHVFGAEIGVRHGDTARYLMDNNKNLMLTLVDPFVAYQDVEHLFTKEEQDGIYEALMNSLKPYVGSYDFRRQTSLEAAEQHGKDYLTFDFVFIDACHTYADCKSDIEAWWPLVKVGGILCGHDYSMNDVKLAVRDTFQETCKGILAWTLPESDIWIMFKE